MSDDDSKPAIPAWQRAQSPQHPPEVKTSNDGAETSPTAPTLDAKTPADVSPPPTKEAENEPIDETGSSSITANDHLVHMKTFLEDPSIKDAPLQKKRAFFESKDIPREQVDQALESEEAPRFKASDLEDFKQRQQPARSTQPLLHQQKQQQAPTSAPPIITYPEYLVEARKPPPLITPSLIINTAYVASGTAAILYGASKYLVKPMSDSLNDARHDFSTHSQSKIDAMNERLEKLVSKVPEPASATEADDDDADEETDSSETSDPTELFHRDMGTQTSPQTSRSNSMKAAAAVDAKKKQTSTERQTEALAILKSHLADMLERAESLEKTNKDRAESMNKLRSYMDTLMFASPGIGAWANAEDLGGAVKDGAAAKAGEDVVEELKREIRGVKGVLLSAKRFPGVAGRAGVVG